MEKLIITAALTGSGVFPTMTPYIPITPEQISEEARRSEEAGAAVVHLHARNPKTGEPTPDINVWREIFDLVKKKSNVIICTTTGGALGMTREERIRVVPELKADMASFNCGSMNFGLFQLLDKIKEWKYEWEVEYCKLTKDNAFLNTFGDMEYFCKVMYENGVKPELEIYDVGHLYNAKFMLSKGILKKPIHMQFVMGTLGGIGADINQLVHLKNTADNLFGKDYTWSVIGVGKSEFNIAAAAITMGGHVRVGLEDNIYVRKGVLAKSNAELVERVVRLADDLDRKIATPDEARKILSLKR